MTTLAYAVFRLNGNLAAVPTGSRSARQIDLMVGLGTNWYGVQASSPTDAISLAQAEGFSPEQETATAT